MKSRAAVTAVFILVCVLGLRARNEGVEAFEIGSADTGELPKGKEADGIIGDFVIRNDKIEATVAGGQTLRRANMTTEYRGPLNGCLFDLDLRGSANDQLTAFRPAGEEGEMSWVRVAKDGTDGEAVVESIRTAAKGEGLGVRHSYHLKEGWSHILVRSLYRNESATGRSVTPRPVWKGLVEEQRVGGVHIGDSVDAFDKRAYAWSPAPGTGPLPESVEIGPGETKEFAVVLAVADSPLAAYGVIASLLGKTGEVTGRAADPQGRPAVHGRLLVKVKGEELAHYPDAEGQIAFRLPPDDYEARFHDIGRDEVAKPISVDNKRRTLVNLQVPPASQVSFTILDEAGRPSPGKVQFLGINGTPTPDFGTDYRAHGGGHQYQSHDGRFTQQTPPGDYLIRITRGPEFDLFEKEIAVAAGQTVEVKTALKRSVDTAGWVSTDFHSHSTPSGDNYCGTSDRIINLVAEHIEFAPATEHNRLYDWAPHIERLGVGHLLRSVPGIELTGNGQHFNSFPMTPHPYTQRGGGPIWHYDPRVSALTLRDWITPTLQEGGSRFDSGGNANRRLELDGGGPDRWVQANHPIVGTVFNDRDGDGVADGGFADFADMIDAGEFWSGEILNLNPVYHTYLAGEKRKGQNRTLGWLQLLNLGQRVWCVAVSDAHRIYRNGVGDWRTYVPSSTDDPKEIVVSEIVRNAKAGRMMITNGPFLEVATADGHPIGSSVVSEGGVDLKVKVQAPDWIAIDRVQVIVNGRAREEDNYTRARYGEMFRGGTVRFDEVISVKLQRDAHVIVAALSEKTNLKKGWGLAGAGEMRPMAYTNPIFVDVDGKGFQANGDTLGWPLLVTPEPSD